MTPTNLIGAHHIECARASQFSLKPKGRKTELYYYNKSEGQWSTQKKTVRKLNFTKKSTIKELEDEFTKCETWFREDLFSKIKSKSNYAIIKDEDRKNFATYLAMNLSRNPDNLDAMLARIGLSMNDILIRNKLTDDLIPKLSNLFYFINKEIIYRSITTSSILVCPDSIIYSVHHKNKPNKKYHIMPLSHNKYIIGSFVEAGTVISNSGMNIHFTANQINDFSFMSNCNILCGDDKSIKFNQQSDYVVNNFIYH